MRFDVADYVNRNMNIFRKMKSHSRKMSCQNTCDLPPTWNSTRATSETQSSCWRWARKAAPSWCLFRSRMNSLPRKQKTSQSSGRVRYIITIYRQRGKKFREDDTEVLFIYENWKEEGHWFRCSELGWVPPWWLAIRDPWRWKRRMDAVMHPLALAPWWWWWW